jgi:hypothetical protein
MLFFSQGVTILLEIRDHDIDFVTGEREQL